MTAEGRAGGRQVSGTRERHPIKHGLFQGKLDSAKPIALLEEGCKELSKITGLTYISFGQRNIRTALEIRRVLEREGILTITANCGQTQKAAYRTHGRNTAEPRTCASHEVQAWSGSI
jgi:hypothetical protein